MGRSRSILGESLSFSSFDLFARSDLLFFESPGCRRSSLSNSERVVLRSHDDAVRSPRSSSLRSLQPSQAGSFIFISFLRRVESETEIDLAFVFSNQVGGGIYRGFSWGRTKRELTLCCASTDRSRAQPLPPLAEFPLFLAAKHDPQPNSTIFEERMKASAQDAEDPDFKDELEKVRGYGDSESFFISSRSARVCRGF